MASVPGHVLRSVNHAIRFFSFRDAPCRGQQGSADLSGCLNYLDDAVKIDGTVYPRRAVVLAIEDLKQPIDAPLSLQIEARAQMGRLKFDPITELKLYRDIATAILRMDAALRLTAMTKAQEA